MEILMILGLIFITGFLVLIGSRKLGVPVIPGLILAGILVSSFVSVGDLSDILILGISFLIFYIGLRVDLDGFRKVSSTALNISLIQIIIAFLLALYVSLYLGFEIHESLYIALAGSLASTLAGTDIFDRNLRMDLHHGQISTAANFIHDVLAVIIISGLAAGLTTQGLHSVGLAVLMLLTAFVFRELFSKKFHSLIRSAELRVVSMVAIYAFSIGLAGYLDLSPVATAFAAGLALSRGSETEEILDVLEPLKDFFSVILFVGLGSLIVTPSIAVLKLAALITAGVIILRPLIISLVMLVTGHGARKAFKTSANLMQVSEFSIAAILLAWMSGMLTNQILEAVIISAVITMIVSTFVTRHSDQIFELIGKPFIKTEKLLENQLASTQLQDHVIVVGFDRRGQEVAEQLEKQGRKFLVVDYNIENIERAEIENIDHIFGDIIDDRTLEAANISNADKIIVTSDHKPVIDKISSIPNISKVLMVENRGVAEKIRSENTEILIESEMVKEALKERISELISEN